MSLLRSKAPFSSKDSVSCYSALSRTLNYPETARSTLPNLTLPVTHAQSHGLSSDILICNNFISWRQSQPIGIGDPRGYEICTDY